VKISEKIIKLIVYIHKTECILCEFDDSFSYLNVLDDRENVKNCIDDRFFFHIHRSEGETFPMIAFNLVNITQVFSFKTHISSDFRISIRNVLSEIKEDGGEKDLWLEMKYCFYPFFAIFV
jgi:hypothetical protein